MFKPSSFKIIEPTGTFDLHGGQGGALCQVGGMETEQQPEVPLCVNERGGETAEVWSGDRLLVRLQMIKHQNITRLEKIMKNEIHYKNLY